MNLYLIARNGRTFLFSPADAVAAMESESTDHVRQFIEWFARRPNRVLGWAGRTLRTLHDYYVKLEDKIDPCERVLKAMASTTTFVVHGSKSDFHRVLKRQRLKHLFWFSIDFVLTGVVIVFTPVLAPIPGPNVFFYYPFLRLLSHYRAILGAASGLRSSDVQFKDLPELRSLEDNLSGLTSFLERME